MYKCPKCKKEIKDWVYEGYDGLDSYIECDCGWRFGVENLDSKMMSLLDSEESTLAHFYLNVFTTILSLLKEKKQ